jgi:predicted O-methyltransferase YrrM
MTTSIEELLSYSLAELIFYIRFSAGLSNPTTGGGLTGIVGGKDNLQLQQNPEEYARLLLFLKETKAKSYLELGVGQGGSFLLCSLFQPDIKICHAVDNCDYQRNAQGFSDQPFSIQNKVEYLKKVKNIEVQYFNYFTDDFFNLGRTNTYDIIFIDADHRYEGVKKDYENSLKILNSNGFLIFHDIVNKDLGVKKFWNELDPSKKIHEFVYSISCGIGIYKP